MTIGLATARRFPWKDAVPYIVTQIIAAVAAAGTLWLIAINQKGQSKDALSAGGLGSNGYGDHSPALFNVTAGLVTEIVFTTIFVVVILGITDRRAPKGYAGLTIGLTLTMIHLATISVTGTSVNPARSTGPAFVALLAGESWPIKQLWLFWVAPIIGTLLGAVVYRFVGQHVGEGASEDGSVNPPEPSPAPRNRSDIVPPHDTPRRTVPLGAVTCDSVAEGRDEDGLDRVEAVLGLVEHDAGRGLEHLVGDLEAVGHVGLAP